MGLGVISISTNAKKEMPGPPFASNSADNGLSVDATSGRIVLGNDVGAAGDPAQLLNDREIRTTDALLNLFGVIFNAVAQGVTTELNGQQILITGADNSIPQIDMQGGDNAAMLINMQGTDGAISDLFLITGVGGLSRLRIQCDGDQLNIFADGNGQIFKSVGFTDIWSCEVATFNQQFGPTLVAHNGAGVQLSATTTYRHLTQSQGAGAYNVDRDLDSGKVFTNSGAVTFNLPNMAAANFREGFIFRAVVNNTAGITITAFAGQTIRFGSLATTVGGTLSSTDQGAFVKLILMDSITWVTESFNGAWVVA